MTINSCELGPIIGHCWIDDTTSRASVRIWIRAADLGKGVIAYKMKSSDDSQFKEFSLINSLADNNGNALPGMIELDDLAPGQTYEYKIGVTKATIIDPSWDSWSDLPTYEFRTFEKQAPKTRFLFGSCRHYGNLPFRQGDTAFKTMLKNNNHNADFIVMAGDQVYVDYSHRLFGGWNPFKVNKSPKTYKGYLKKYQVYYDQTGFRNVCASLPCYMIYDDHEILNNWSRYSLKHGKETDVTKSNYNNGIRAYMGHQSLFSPVVSDNQFNPELMQKLKTATSEYVVELLKDVHYYYEFEHGNCAFFMMDVRGERQHHECQKEDYPDCPEGHPEKVGQMISQKQLGRLMEFLEKYPRKIKFIVSPTPFFPDYFKGFAAPTDIWTGYAKQRLEIVKKIADIAAETPDFVLPVFLGGDVHQGARAKAHYALPNSDQHMVLHSIVSSAFNWYIFGVQRNAPRTGPLIASWRKEAPRNESPVFCQVDDFITLRNHYALIEATHSGIRVQHIRSDGKPFSGTGINTAVIPMMDLKLQVERPDWVPE